MREDLTNILSISWIQVALVGLGIVGLVLWYFRRAEQE